MTNTVGAISFNEEFFSKINRCPATVFVGGEIPRCDAFGSAGPFMELKRPCTYKEMQKCPIHKFNYTSAELLNELEKFLIRNNNRRGEPQAYCPYLRKSGSYYKCVHPSGRNPSKDGFYYQEPCTDPDLWKCYLIKGEKNLILRLTVEEADE